MGGACFFEIPGKPMAALRHRDGSTIIFAQMDKSNKNDISGRNRHSAVSTEGKCLTEFQIQVQDFQTRNQLRIKTLWHPDF